VAPSRPPAAVLASVPAIAYKMKGGQYAPLVSSHWYHSVSSVGAGSNHSPYSGWWGSCIGCYRSYSHSALVDICDLLATALGIDFLPFGLSL